MALPFGDDIMTYKGVLGVLKLITIALTVFGAIVWYIIYTDKIYKPPTLF